MPKTKISPIDWDTPIWDALVVEIPDPRPYEAGHIAGSYAPDPQPFIDPDYFDDLLYELAIEAEDACSAVEGHRELGIAALDKIYELPPHVAEWYNMTEVTTQFATVGALPAEN